MKHRDALLHTVLSLFIPFFILYWLYITAKEIEQTYGHKAPSIFLLLAPGIIVFVSILLLLIGLATTSEEGAAFSGGVFILTFFVLLPLSTILSLVYFYKFGGNVEKVVGQEASRILTFILLWFVSPAAVFIVQEKLNRLTLQGGYAQQQPAPQQPYTAQPPSYQDPNNTPQPPQPPQPPQTPTA